MGVQHGFFDHWWFIDNLQCRKHDRKHIGMSAPSDHKSGSVIETHPNLNGSSFESPKSHKVTRCTRGQGSKDFPSVCKKISGNTQLCHSSFHS